MRSEHPLGKAIVAHGLKAGMAPPEPDRFDYAPGYGVTALIGNSTIIAGSRALMIEHQIELPKDSPMAGSEIFVARDGILLGTIELGDIVRREAKQAVDRLNRLGGPC